MPSVTESMKLGHAPPIKISATIAMSCHFKAQTYVLHWMRHRIDKSANTQWARGYGRRPRHRVSILRTHRGHRPLGSTTCQLNGS
ncbi:hypothetical protein DPMN_014003 [Dreissena polymorpha]|uniref:Uncharacterized protein n=1 Tax=Dreissena polymorpha TaxID=45954 RepID=A0A9D4S324_DREPO|nr:hypothetical protein DPMN_014003 [Dreissena polymorpha]